MKKNLVNVEKLNVYYKQGRGSFHAVKDAAFSIKPGEILALIGESGSGKTTIAKAIMSQVAFNAKTIKVNNISIPSSPDLKTKTFRKKSAYLLQMIFQSPASSLNPFKRVWKVIAEGMLNAKYDKNTRKSKIDLVQENYFNKMYEFNKILKSNLIDKKINEYHKIMKSIKKNNNNILEIDKSKRTLLNYFELVDFDQFYNDLLSETTNKIDDERNVMLSKGSHALLNLKRYYKALYRSAEESYDIKQNKISKEEQQKIKITFNNRFKKAINKKDIENLKVEMNSKLGGRFALESQLKKINISYKEEKEKLIEIKKESMIDFKNNKNKIKKLYDKYLKEYSIKRKDLINKIISSKVLKQNKKSWKEKLKKRNDLYRNVRVLVKEIDNLFFTESKTKNLHEQYLKERGIINNKIKQEIKISKWPYGSKKDIKEKVFKLLNEVGLPNSIAYSFPSQLSGGQQQRIAIARAFSMNPKFIIADEPISSLDVSLQGSIINIIRKLASENKTSILFISHDLEMTRRVSNRVMVMNRGRIVESGKTNIVFANPIHPYTRMLISSSKTIDEALVGKKAFIYTEKDNYESNDKRIYNVIKKDHKVFANSNELVKWGGK